MTLAIRGFAEFPGLIERLVSEHERIAFVLLDAFGWAFVQRHAGHPFLRRLEIEKVASGGKPLMFLEAATARSIQGPATMDGIGPTRGWETYWMEVDVKRRRGAPWAAPVPTELVRKLPHLTAAE